MEMAEYQNIFQNETNHFLYTSRHNLIVSLIKTYLRKKGRINILDTGCGTGLLAKKLTPLGNVDAIDISDEAIKFARKRGVNAKKASVTKIPFKDNNFDLVTSIDVLYHHAVKDDIKALKEIFRVLVPGGILILRVPANKWIKTKHDKFVHTRERYEKSELKSKLESAGFSIKKLSFVNLPLLPLAFIRHMVDNLSNKSAPTSAVETTPEVVNQTLKFILDLETKIIKYIDLPFGIGLIAVCHKSQAMK